MKALTVLQPYASLIRSGAKSIETRKRYTHFRGELLICAGQRLLPVPSIYHGPPIDSLPRGVAICIVNVVGCREMSAADWPAACCDPYETAWAWILENPRKIEPFPVKGRQNLFNVTLPESALL